MDMHGWTAKDLSEAIGVEATTVYRSLALLRLPDDVAERVDAGEIKATAAYEIAKLQIADDQRAVAEAVISGDLDHKATVNEVARRKAASKATRTKGGGSKAKRRPASSRVFRTAPGIRITAERGRGVEPAALVEALEEALAIVKGELAGSQAA
jgi:ParB family transcriptional regulator, chromosome partitioning protein